MNYAICKWLIISMFANPLHQPAAKKNIVPPAPPQVKQIKLATRADTSIRTNDVITRTDEANIKWKAEAVVKRFMKVLNVLATGLYLQVPESEKIIRNSYAQPTSKIFDDSTVIIADDLRQVESNKLVKEMPVFSYLKDFDLYYEKSESETVAFGNFKVSNVKKAQYLYIKVYFDCLFKNKSKISETPYRLMRKVAELKLEKQQNKWNAWIIDIHFLDSSDIHQPEKNDLPIVDDPAGSDVAGLQADESIADKAPDASVPSSAADRERLRKENDSVRTYMAYKNLKDSGDHAFNRQQFISAYQFYNEAENVASHSQAFISKNARDYLETMISQTRKNIAIADRSPDEQYAQFMQSALVARNQRKYDEAVDYYNKALQIKPSDESTKAKKHELTTWINNLSRLEGKFKAGKYKDAINDYDLAIKAEPANSDYYLGRGKCYEQTKDLKKAMSDYKKAIELDENNLQAFFTKGTLHEKQGAFAEALASFTVCASNDKHDVASFVKMADMNLAVNNAAAALNALDKGILNNSNAAILFQKKGEIFYQQKKMVDAADAFSKSIQLDSMSSNTYYRRGLCELSLKNINAAGDDFVRAKALGLDADASASIQKIATDFYNEGTSKLNAGKPELALSSLSYAVAIEPGKDQYRYQKASGYFALKDYANAVSAYTEAIKLNPENYDAYKQRALSKFYLAQYKEAITDFETAMKINPRAAETYKYMGDTYMKLKDYNKAISSYDQTLDAPKSSRKSLDDAFFAELYNNKGEAYYQIDKLPLAMQNFKNAIENNNKNGQIYFNRGKTYIKLKELNNAEDDFKKALDLDANNPQWNFSLGEIYQLKEKYEKAIKQYNLALSLDSTKLLAFDPVYSRAVCNVMLTNYSDALKDYTNIQTKNAESKYPLFHTELGNLYLEVNQPDSALKHFNIANTDASDPLPMYGKGIAYVQKKQVDEALNWLEKSFALNKLPKSLVTKDRRLASIRDDKRFKGMMKKYF